MIAVSISKLVVLHAMAVSAGAALMWLVGCLSYPLFAYVPSAAFEGYHAQHCRRITPPVGFILLCQGATSFALCMLDPCYLYWSYLLLTGAGVLITGALAAPLHSKLGTGFESTLFHNLQRAHALRTVVWTAHLAVVVGQLCLFRAP